MASTQLQSFSETGASAKGQAELIRQESSSAAPAREEIAALAYSYWQSQGCPDGCELENWLRAEESLRSGRSDLPGDHYDSNDKS